MAMNIIETPERSKTGSEIEKTPQQEENQAAETPRFTFTAEQRKILAQTYQMILGWAKPKVQSGLTATIDAAATDTEA